MPFSSTALATRRWFPVDPIYVADANTLRGITTSSMLCFITGFFSGGVSTPGAGWFIRDDNDTTSGDDGVDCIVASNGKRWKRIFEDSEVPQYVDYAALRATSGVSATIVEVIGSATNAPAGIAGVFQLDSDDVTTADDGGTVIVNAGGQRFKRQYTGWISPKWFGATVGTGDSTTAISNAIGAALTKNEGLCIDGEYSIYGPITKSGAFALSMVGLGPSVSRIIYQTITAGIEVTSSTVSAAGEFTFHNVALVANAENIPFALKVHGQMPGSGRKPVGLQMNHCFIGYDSHTGDPGARHFATGLHMDTCRDSTFVSCIFYGKRPPAGRVGNGVYFEGDGTSGPTFIGCQFYHWDKGITKKDTGAVSSEGIIVDSCIFVTNNWGIHCKSPIGDPDVVVSNSHFNCEEGAIYLDNHNQIFLHNNLYYANTASVSYIDVRILNCTGFTSHDNTYGQAAAAATAKGIVVSGMAMMNVHDETFLGNCRAVALEIGAGCARLEWRDNHWESIPTPVVNNTTQRERWVRKTYLAPGYAMQHSPTAMALVNATDTKINTWVVGNLTETYTGMWVAGTPSRLIVPPDVTLVRVSAGVSFDANAAGSRQIKLLKNGAIFNGSPNQRTLAAATGASVLSVASGLLEVVPGDYFEVEVTQSSGGALNTTANQHTFFNMEIVG